MKTNMWIATGLFAILLTISGTAPAHDGDNGGDGRGGWSHSECHHMKLSDDKRQLLHETMKKIFEQDQAQIEQMHKLHHEMHDVLGAEIFDQRKFLALSAQIEKIRDKLHRDRLQAFASIAGQFTPEEREMLARMHGHHHHHDGGWDGHRHDGALPQQDNAYPPYPSR